MASALLLQQQGRCVCQLQSPADLGGHAKIDIATENVRQGHPHYMNSLHNAKSKMADISVQQRVSIKYHPTDMILSGLVSHSLRFPYVKDHQVM